MLDATRSNPGCKHGKHPEKALSAAFVRTVTRPGRYCDGQGLYVLVLPSGARCWVQRLVIKGRRRELGLGGYPLVSLAEAREMAFAQRKVARADGDPLATRRSVHGQLTFEAAAARVLDQQRPGWRNAKHALDWPRSLRAYAFPRIGAAPISEVTTADVLAILTPIWHTKPATARRVRQRIGAVMKGVVARIVPGPHDAHRQDPHWPMRYDTGRPISVIRLRISQPRTTSLPCPAGLRARKPSPMMDL